MWSWLPFPVALRVPSAGRAKEVWQDEAEALLGWTSLDVVLLLPKAGVKNAPGTFCRSSSQSCSCVTRPSQPCSKALFLHLLSALFPPSLWTCRSPNPPCLPGRGFINRDWTKQLDKSLLPLSFCCICGCFCFSEHWVHLEISSDHHG